MTINDRDRFPHPGIQELPPRSPQAEREVRRDTPMRRARTCYGHLAGVAGVNLFDRLLDQGWIESAEGPASPKPDYILTETGEAAMRARGIDAASFSKAKRRFAYGCTDWTERRHHLGGALGEAITVALAGAGYLTRHPGTRVAAISKEPSSWAD